MKITTFDTTLRDGTQGEFVCFSVEDKLTIARKLDELGIDYIEGGWPGSNPRDKEFFTRAKADLALKHAKLCAFGATHFARYTVDTDPSIRELVDAGTPAISIFGKTWDFHVLRALNITLEENLRWLQTQPGLCSVDYPRGGKRRRRCYLFVRYERRNSSRYIVRNCEYSTTTPAWDLWYPCAQ
jgi:isopropylmalate/homocitrate/citramalate synthase